MCPVKLTGLRSAEGIAPDADLCPVKVDRTRPVEEIRLGELTGNDRTLMLVRPVTLSNASDHHLTIEIGRIAFEADDTWQASGDRTVGSCVWSI